MEKGKKICLFTVLLISISLLLIHDACVAGPAPSPLTIQSSLPAATETVAGYFVVNAPVPYAHVELSWFFSNGMDQRFNQNIKNISIKEKGSNIEIFFDTTPGTVTITPSDIIVTNSDFIWTKSSIALTLKPTTVGCAPDTTYVVTIDDNTTDANAFLSNNSGKLVKPYYYEFTTSQQLAITSAYPQATQSATAPNYYVLDMPVAHDNATFQWEFTGGWDRHFARNIANISICEKGSSDTEMLFDVSSGTKTAPIPDSADNMSLQIENNDFHYRQEFVSSDNADLFMLELKPKTVGLQPNKIYVISIAAGDDNSSLFQGNDNSTLLATCFYEFSTNDSASVVAFTARPGNKKVTLQWQTDDEKASQGFNLLRAESADGPFEKINNALIAGKGSEGVGSLYCFVDRPVQNRRTYFYKLENIDVTGASSTRGEAEAKPRLLYFWRELLELLRLLLGNHG